MLNTTGYGISIKTNGGKHMATTTEKTLLGVLVVLALGIASVLVAANKPFSFASTMQEAEDAEDQETEVAITGSALDKASAAALAYVGEGTVTETEVGDEEGYYEVEVTLNDGRQVDVHLDENFNVLGHIADEEEDGE
jgi:uncharacterized membrane protein YkoI